jgi:phosphoribosylglycinamide formyltransferase-1
MSRPAIAVLASGEGTTAEAVIVASSEKHVSFDVSLIIASKENAGIFKRVENLNKKYNTQIPCLFAADDAMIQKLLEKYQPELIVLMGYMKKIGPEIVEKYGWRKEYTNPYQAKMLNTHPGLLPATKGLYGIYVQEFVLTNSLPVAGQTLHIVSENYDEGPVVAEHQIDVAAGETPDTLFERVKIIEKQYLPSDINDFITKRREYLKDNG